MTDNPIISKAVSARYEDETYSSIWVEWISPDDGKLRTHSIPADPSNSDYQDLLAEGWDEAAFQKQTEAYKRQASRDINVLIRKAAEELAEEAIQRRVEVAVGNKMNEVNAKLMEADKRLEKSEKANLKADQLLNSARIQADNKLWDALLEANENKDEVFKFKLWALEQEKSVNATAEQKKELRKQPTLFDCITYFNSL